MTFANSVQIEAPLDKVVALFDNPENLKRWQPGFISFETLSGVTGQPGARSRLVYQMGKRRMEMIETVTLRSLPSVFNGHYESKGVHHEVRNRFEAVSPAVTRWTAESDFRFDSFGMRVFAALLPGVFRKQSLKFMERFKNFAESH